MFSLDIQIFGSSGKAYFRLPGQFDGLLLEFLRVLPPLRFGGTGWTPAVLMVDHPISGFPLYWASTKSREDQTLLYLIGEA